MPRSLPPPTYPNPKPLLFALPQERHQDIARALGLPLLPPTTVEQIEADVSHYKSMAALPNNTTVGSSIAAVDAVLKAEKALEVALQPFRPTCSPYDRSRLDYETRDGGVPAAVVAALSGVQIRDIMEPLRKRLSGLQPVDPRTEKLSVFCSRLRLLFEAVGRGGPDDKRKRLHAFLLIILKISGIERKTYDTYRNQPQRLDRRRRVQRTQNYL
jgi:hypothetical protein